MRVANALAGYSLGEADLLRRAMGKKKAEEMAKQRDRFLHGAVVDYLDFHLAGWHWPAFNIADVAICIGAGMIAFLAIKSGKQFNSQHSGGANANY